MIVYRISMETRDGSTTTARASYIVPRRVYDAIRVLLNPSQEGLSIHEGQDHE